MPVLSEKLQTAVCAALSSGMSMTELEGITGVKRAQIYYTASVDAAFSKRLHDARVLGTDAILDEVLDVGRDKAANKDEAASKRVHVDTLLRYAGKINPNKYGDRMQMDIRGTLDMGAILIAADARLAALPLRAPPIQLPDVSAVPSTRVDGTAELIDVESAADLRNSAEEGQ